MSAAHVVSVSGGKDSTALYLLALERMQKKGRPFIAVFADTGNEHPATYEAVATLAQRTGGPEIQWVKVDMTRRFAGKRKWIQEKWPAHGVAPALVEQALGLLHPTGNPFLDLCMIKGRFPSTRARFCTEFLKVKPIAQQVYAPLVAAGRPVISWQGVRAQESLARSLLARWQRIEVAEAPGGRIYAYRPLLAWTLEDVWAMHARHGIARNPLYDQGMNRVGCMPCIMCGKDELREIAVRFPEHVERIAQWEELVSAVSKRGCATFFSISDDPTVDTDSGVQSDWSPATHGIRRRVEWSKTSRGGRQYDMELAADFGTACNQWGACE